MPLGALFSRLAQQDRPFVLFQKLAVASPSFSCHSIICVLFMCMYFLGERKHTAKAVVSACTELLRVFVHEYPPFSSAWGIVLIGSDL